MNYIRKLPFILGAGMAIIIGIVNDCSGAELKDVYIRMSIGLVSFFILGLYIRGTIYKIDDELRIKREEEELQRKTEELERQREELERKKAEKAEKMAKERKSTIDYTVDEDLENDMLGGNTEMDAEENDGEQLYDEEFEPLKVKNVTLDDS